MVIFLLHFSILKELINKKGKVTRLKSAIIKQLYFDRCQSCAEIGEAIQKNTQLVSRTIGELITEGMVTERGYAPSSGGRRAQTYSLVQNARYILAVAMDQLSTRIQLFDFYNQPVAAQQNFRLELHNNSDALGTLASYINHYLITTGTDRSLITGVGIGMPGFVNVKAGINHSYLDSGQQTIVEFLQAATGLPVYIDNDSSLTALAEKRFGNVQSRQDIMVINIGWGIGLGMVIGGEVFRGCNGFAGELSHIPIMEEGALCICGKQGCLEAEASMLAVARKAQRAIKKGQLTTLQAIKNDCDEEMADAIIEAGAIGDPFAIDLLSEAGYKIGKALAILIHIMNPEAIVLSGRGATAGKILLAPIQQAINKYCIPRLAADTHIQVSELGHAAQMIGAAVLVMENFNLLFQQDSVTPKEVIMDK